MAAREALRVARIGVHDIATFDLYSCFPFPVFVICELSVSTVTICVA